MGLFWAAHRWGGGGKKALFPKICHTYPTMMEFGTIIAALKKILKIYKSHDMLTEFC